MDYTQLSLFGKTSPEPSAPTKEKTSASYSKSSAKSVIRKPRCLRWIKGDGHMQMSYWAMDGVWLTELSTLNTGESPSVAVESTLSAILEANAQEKYYLSAKACEGILRRSSKRGKELPKMLQIALEQQIVRMSE